MASALGAGVYHISIHSAADLYMAMQRVLSAGTTTAAQAVGHRNIPILTERLSAEDWGVVKLDGHF